MTSNAGGIVSSSRNTACIPGSSCCLTSIPSRNC